MICFPSATENGILMYKKRVSSRTTWSQCSVCRSLSISQCTYVCDVPLLSTYETKWSSSDDSCWWRLKIDQRMQISSIKFKDSDRVCCITVEDGDIIDSVALFLGTDLLVYLALLCPLRSESHHSFSLWLPCFQCQAHYCELQCQQLLDLLLANI